MDGYLTTDEIAQRLGVKVETVRRWVRQGKLSGLPLGRAGYRIRQEDFDHFLQNEKSRHSLPDSTTRTDRVHNVGETHMEAAATLTLERMTDGVLLFGLDGKCQYANWQAEQLLGLAPDDLIGKTIAQVLPRIFTDGEKSIGQNDYFSVTTSRWYQVRIFSTPQGRCVSFFNITERKQLEEQLYLREQQFITLVEHLPDVIFRLDKQLRHLYISPMIQHITGIAPQNWIGKTGREMGLPSSICDQFEALCQKAMTNGEEQRMEFFHQSHWQRSRIIPEFTSDGSVHSLMGVTEDITQRIQSEQALRDVEQRVQAERQRLYDLFIQAPAAIMVTKGPDHVYELLNPPAVQFLGVHRQYIGKPGREAVPEAVEQGFFDLLDAVYQTGKPFIGNELPAQFPSKGEGTLEQLYFNFVYQPMYNASGEIDGVPGYINNVTDLVVARKRIEESEERFRAMANSMPQLVWSANADGKIDFFNERMNEYAQMHENEDGIYEWQAIVHPDDREAVQHNWEQATKTGNAFEHELRLRMKNGSYRWHLTRGIPVHDANGSIVRWYGTKTDIEQLKQLEQQKNDFIGVVSHELKTPVTSAKAFAEVLESRFHRAGDEKSANLLAKMNAQMNKLTLLIGDLLDVTRIEAGKLQFHEDFFAFDELVDNIIEEVQRTTSHTIRREGTTDTTVYGDRERIGQVITNLLTNAIKYSPNAPTVIVKTSRAQKDVMLCVQDSGIGIARDKLSHVFERFFRETNTEGNTFPGLGLGLYVASEIISRQGGRIWAESEKGQGSTFCFTLPLQESKNTRHHEDMFIEEDTRE